MAPMAGRIGTCATCWSSVAWRTRRRESEDHLYRQAEDLPSDLGGGEEGERGRQRRGEGRGWGMLEQKRPQSGHGAASDREMSAAVARARVSAAGFFCMLFSPLSA